MAGNVKLAGRAPKLVIQNKPLFTIPHWAAVTGHICGLLIRLLLWAVKHPKTTIGVVAGVWLGLAIGPSGVALLSLGLSAALSVWFWFHRSSFTTWVTLPSLTAWRRSFVYRPGWASTMHTCGLSIASDSGPVVPVLLKVTCSEATDRLVVRMLGGQSPEEFQKQAEKIAYSFGARTARVYTKRPDAPPVRSGRFAWLLRRIDAFRWADRPARLHIVIAREDPLTEIVKPFQIGNEINLKALPLGLTSSLEVYKFCLLATHLLVAGASRRGKGSVIWSLIRALAPAIKSGLVRLWVVDPKGGMELSFGKSMFTKFAYQDFESMAVLLEDAVMEMQRRQSRLAGVVRAHTPTVDEPLIVVVIDEIAALTSYLKDAELRKRIEGALGLLLSQGAGVGVLVVAALQDPRKETLPARDLFLSRILLGVTDDVHVDMVLGDGARKSGAHADKLDVNAKGVGFVMVDGTPEPVQVRFSYLDDDDIKTMADEYPAPKSSGAPKIPTQPDRRSTGQLLPNSLLKALEDEGSETR